jgi:hypothetical protein
MKVLKEDVEHHADEQEKEIFKEARKLGNNRLGARQKVTARKERLQVA